MKLATLAELKEAVAARRAAILATNLDTGAERLIFADGLDGEPLAAEARTAFGSDRSDTVQTAEGPVFLNVHNPPLRLIVIGAVHIAQFLIPIAALAGYDVTVIDPRGAFATVERFPGVTLADDWPDEVLPKAPPDARTAMVALTHDPKIDDPALDIALASDAFYIGALGSKKTHAGRCERLAAERGIEAARLARIHGPIGLAIGARSPAEVAIAIMAEITNALRGGAL